MTWGSLWKRFDDARPARLRVLIFVVVTLVLLGLIAHPNQAASGDPVHYMVVARSIAFDQDFDVGNDYSDPTNIVQEPAGSHAQLGVNGVFRPVHDVGLPLVAAPFFAVAYALAQMTDRLPLSLREEARLNRFIALR